MPKTLTELDKELDALAVTLSGTSEQEGLENCIEKTSKISDKIL